MAIRRIEGLLHLASEGRYAILVGRFNSFVVEHLLEGAIDTLKRHGVSEDAITVIHAPGAWELPIVAKKLAASNKFDAIIALGAVIRGSTPHFDFVAGEKVELFDRGLIHSDLTKDEFFTEITLPSGSSLKNPEQKMHKNLLDFTGVSETTSSKSSTLKRTNSPPLSPSSP